MKDGIRLFVASTLTDDIKALLQIQAQLYRNPAVRIIPEQNLHLTLFFIGNTPASNLETIKESVQQTAKDHSAFNLNYLCTEPGPNPSAPRLIWARFVQHPEFEKLSRHLATVLSQVQNARQKPIPHITLARYKKDTPLPHQIRVQHADPGLSINVNSISLWQSELASPHPVYRVLETYALAAKL